MPGSCEGETQSGRPCQAPPLKGSRFCFHHDPAKARERQEARSKGGRERVRQQRQAATPGAPQEVDLRSPDQVLAHLEDELAAVLDGLEVSARRAKVVARLLKLALKSLEVGDLAERVEALEELVSERAMGNGGM